MQQGWMADWPIPGFPAGLLTVDYRKTETGNRNSHELDKYGKFREGNLF
jgi:hypothetical protein